MFVRCSPVSAAEQGPHEYHDFSVVTPFDRPIRDSSSPAETVPNDIYESKKDCSALQRKRKRSVYWYSYAFARDHQAGYTFERGPHE